MGNQLDVLLVEHRPGVGARDVQTLEEAGHRVQRCHSAPWEDGERNRHDRHLCAALKEGTCPLDLGVDVALLVRPRISPRPSIYEQGVTCAVRSGVPVVEAGPDALDPFAGVIDLRVEFDVVDACETAARERYERIAEAIRKRIDLSGTAATSSPEVEVGRDGDRLVVVVSGPDVEPLEVEAIVGSTLDAIGEVARGFAKVDVRYQATG
jgi:hypothetical protein